MKIAYCFYGQPRKLEEGYAIVQQFISLNPTAEIDFFYHTWFIKGTTDYQYEAAPWRQLSKEELTIRPNAIDILQTYYNPKAFAIDEPMQFDISSIKESILYKKTPEQQTRNINNNLSKYYSIQQVRSVLETYVKNTNTRYEYVVLNRFDFLKPIRIQMDQLEMDRLYVSDVLKNRKLFCNCCISDYDRFLKIANVFETLKEIMNNDLLISQFKLYTRGECIFNAEEINAVQYMYYYTTHDTIIYTPLIPDFH